MEWSREAYDAAWNDLERKDQEAKNKNTLIGRFFTEPVADGQAVYIVDEIDYDKQLVKISLDDNELICDGYQHSYFGFGRWIELHYAKQKIEGRDLLKSFFA